MVHTPGSEASLRKAYNVAVLVLGLLLLLSILWYKQRMLFVDPSWITFEILKKGDLSISEHRYGAAVTQLWVLVASKLHVPLRVLLQLYSASFFVFYFIVALLVGRVLRQYALAILLVMYQTLIVSDVYFWPNNEVHQGVGWMLLFLGLFARYQAEGRTPIWAHLVMLGALFLAVFSHFIVIVPFTFLGAYWLLNGREYWNTNAKRLQLAFYLVAAVSIFIYKLNLGRTGWYDREKLLPVLHLKPDALLASFSNGGAKTMLKLLWENYWIVIPVFISGVVTQIRLRKWWLLVLTLLYTAGFFSLVCLTYANAYGRDLLFYMESEWMAWGIIIATPWVVHVLPSLKQQMAVALVATVLIVRLGYIYGSYLHFDKRYRTLDAVVEELHIRGINKAALVARQKESDSTFVMSWGLAYESLMLSGIKGYVPQISFYQLEPGQQIPEPNNMLLLGSQSKDTARKMPSFYFQADGEQKYQVMPMREILERVKLSGQER